MSLDRTDGVAGILSKDAMNLGTGGHLTLGLRGGELWLRLQSATGDHEFDALGVPLSSSSWQRVTVLFGEPGLRLLLSDEQGRLLGEWALDYHGGLGASSGGAGNLEPLVLGAASWISDELSATPSCYSLTGALDELALYSLD